MNITLTVRGTDARGYVRGITFRERRALLAQESGKPGQVVIWPVPETTSDGYKPCRKPSADGTSCKACVPCKARATAYRDAVGKASDLLDLLARGMNAGHSVAVNVETGATFGDVEKGTFGNIVSPALLSDLCNDDDVTVTVAAGADDPRDYSQE